MSTPEPVHRDRTASITTLQPHNIANLEVTLEEAAETPKLAVPPPPSSDINDPIYLLDANIFAAKTKNLMAFTNPLFNTIPGLRVEYSNLPVREDCFVIFVSHQWITAKTPDDQYRSKHQLLSRAIAQLHQGRVKDKKLYLWIDHCCLPEGRTREAALMLPSIIERCDAVLTPVVETSGKGKWWQTNDQRSGFDNLFEEYQSPAWKGYKADAWCQAETWLTAKQPLHPDCHRFFQIQTARNSKANHDTSRSDDRVHFLFGEREAERNIPPYVLPQLQASKLRTMNPAKGKLFSEKDRPKVKALSEVIQVLVQAAPLSPRSRGKLLSANPRISWKGVEFYTAQINEASTTVRKHQVARFRK
jgi:hypothetical protein